MEEEIEHIKDTILQKLEAILKDISDLRTELKVANQKFEDHTKHLGTCQRHMDLIYGNGNIGIKEILHNHQQFINQHLKEHEQTNEVSKYRWFLAVGIASAIATFGQVAVAYFKP